MPRRGGGTRGELGVALTLVLLATAFVPRLDPGPTAERVTVWPDVVRRGPMNHQVRAVGTLTAEGAVLRIPGPRAHDLAIGQAASVDTHIGLVPGRVSRIDATPTNGIVTVHVRLTGALPHGTRPGLTVEGVVELERLENVVYVGMPAYGREHSTLTIFRLPRGCDVTRTSCEAVRQRVRFGRASIDTIEIVEGLEPGDRVVLSDMSAWDGRDRIRLGPS
jgi:HlyD family secretion protein